MRMFMMLSVMAVLWAIPATAVVDLDANKMGIYYDVTADQQCLDQIGGNDQFSIYIIFTNPVLSTIAGFEAGVFPSSDLVFLGAYLPGSDTPIEGLDDPRDIVVDFYPPLACTEATVLVRLDFTGAPAAFETVDLHLRDSIATVFHGDLPIVLWGTSQIPVDVSTTDGFTGDLSAVLNGECPALPVEAITFGTMKALYR